MDSLLHTGGAVLTAIFVLAVLYSLYTTIKKKARQEKRDNSLSGRKHMHVENLHKYDVQPRNGYICYPVDIKGYTHRFPARFVAVSLSQATKQPYSVYKIGYAEFEKGEITDRNYFYIQPPENDLTCVTDPDVSWQVLAKADTFGEYWQAGMNRVFEDTIIVAHNAPYVIGCILHSLAVYGIHPESVRNRALKRRRKTNSARLSHWDNSFFFPVKITPRPCRASTLSARRRQKKKSWRRPLPQ